MSSREEAERVYGHPLQYAYAAGQYIGESGQMTDEEIRDAVGDRWAVVERYNRCPTCEQWSPCDVRKTSVEPEDT